jgi:hypothetical protein
MSMRNNADKQFVNNLRSTFTHSWVLVARAVPLRCRGHANPGHTGCSVWFCNTFTLTCAFPHPVRCCMFGAMTCQHIQETSSAHRTVAKCLSFVNQRRCGLQTEPSAPAVAARTIAEVQAHWTAPPLQSQHSVSVLPEAISQTWATERLPTHSTSRFNIFGALPTKVARRAVVVSCDLPVATLLQYVLGYGCQAGILLVVPQVI